MTPNTAQGQWKLLDYLLTYIEIQSSMLTVRRRRTVSHRVTWALTQEHSEQLGSKKAGFVVFRGWGTPPFPARQCHQLVWIISWLSGKPTYYSEISKIISCLLISRTIWLGKLSVLEKKKGVKLAIGHYGPSWLYQMLKQHIILSFSFQSYTTAMECERHRTLNILDVS